MTRYTSLFSMSASQYRRTYFSSVHSYDWRLQYFKENIRSTDVAGVAIQFLAISKPYLSLLWHPTLSKEIREVRTECKNDKISIVSKWSLGEARYSQTFVVSACVQLSTGALSHPSRVSVFTWRVITPSTRCKDATIQQPRKMASNTNVALGHVCTRI